MATVAGDSLSAPFGGGESTDAYIQRLLAEDTTDSSEFLKDLISASGLKSAWSDLQRRMRQMERKHMELYNMSCTDVLEQRYVSRREYTAQVLDGLQASVNFMSVKTENIHDETVKLGGRIDEHENKMGHVCSQMEVAEKNQQDLGQQIEEMASSLLADREASQTAISSLAEAQQQAGTAAHRRIDGVSGRVDRHNEDIETLRKTLRDQEDFLGSSRLVDHIRKVCSDLLGCYVLQVDMTREAATASERIIGPVRSDLACLTERVDTAVTRLEGNDQQLLLKIRDCAEQTTALCESCDERFLKAAENIESRATSEALDELTSFTRQGLGDHAERREELYKDSVHKMNEVNSRVCEFQIIMEDHEHALQHHAEELLNRCTKYDLVVCQQRIDSCAIKDKVDKDLRELQTTVEWQSSQLEILGYGKSFGGGGGGGTANTSVVLQAPPTPGQTGAPRSQTPDASPADKSEASAAPASGGFQGKALQPEGFQSERSGTAASVVSGCRTPQALSEAACESPRVSHRPDAPPWSADPLAARVSAAPPPQAQQPQTHVYSLMRTQMECLTQGLLSLGRLSLRDSTLPGLSRASRKALEMELVDHLVCLLHWVTNSRAPVAWEHERLASLALRCAVGAQMDGEARVEDHDSFAVGRRRTTRPSLPAACAGGPRASSAVGSTRAVGRASWQPDSMMSARGEFGQRASTAAVQGTRRGTKLSSEPLGCGRRTLAVPGATSSGGDQVAPGPTLGNRPSTRAAPSRAKTLAGVELAGVGLGGGVAGRNAVTPPLASPPRPASRQMARPPSAELLPALNSASLPGDVDHEGDADCDGDAASGAFGNAPRISDASSGLPPLHIGTAEGAVDGASTHEGETGQADAWFDQGGDSIIDPQAGMGFEEA